MAAAEVFCFMKLQTTKPHTTTDLVLGGQKGLLLTTPSQHFQVFLQSLSCCGTLIKSEQVRP